MQNLGDIHFSIRDVHTVILLVLEKSSTSEEVVGSNLLQITIVDEITVSNVFFLTFTLLVRKRFHSPNEGVEPFPHEKGKNKNVWSNLLFLPN